MTSFAQVAGRWSIMDKTRSNEIAQLDHEPTKDDLRDIMKSLGYFYIKVSRDFDLRTVLIQPFDISEKGTQAGLTIINIAAAIRRYKAEKGMALNAPLPGIIIYSDLDLETFDLAGVANSPVESRKGSPKIAMKPVAVKPQMKVIGPRFKDQSGRIIRALAAMDPSDASRQKSSGLIRVDLDGEIFDLPAEAAEIETDPLFNGSNVTVLYLDNAIVII